MYSVARGLGDMGRTGQGEAPLVALASSLDGVTGAYERTVNLHETEFHSAEGPWLGRMHAQAEQLLAECRMGARLLTDTPARTVAGLAVKGGPATGRLDLGHAGGRAAADGPARRPRGHPIPGAHLAARLRGHQFRPLAAPSPRGAWLARRGVPARAQRPRAAVAGRDLRRTRARSASLGMSAAFKDRAQGRAAERRRW
jgi:hypothetical protein